MRHTRQTEPRLKSLYLAHRQLLEAMETVERVLTPEEENAQLVARYKALLQRRAEEHAKDDADPERQKRIAHAMEELKKRNEERGTPIIDVRH